MTEQHSITPPPELVQQWADQSPIQHSDETWAYELFIAHQAARWGADQELNECCHLLRLQGFDVVDDIRATRRPKPPSLKERALQAWAAADQVAPEYETTPGGSKIWPSEPVPSIRAALLAIAAELEGANG